MHATPKPAAPSKLAHNDYPRQADRRTSRRLASCTVLVVSHAFGEEFEAERVARTIGRGLRAGDPELETDTCPLNAIDGLPGDFDQRMRHSRAIVIAAKRLDHETLLSGCGVFEAATRARQAGVPCYAIARHDELDRFEARILDLQIVLEADGEPGLTAAGKRLAEMV